MRTLKLLGLFVATLLILPAANAQLAQQWVARYAGLKTAMDGATAIASDDTGNVYVTGFAGRGSTGSNIVTIKYTPAGARSWVATYAGGGIARGKAIAVDSGSAVYVLASIDSGGSVNYLTIKYSNTGTLLWMQMFDGPAHGEDTPVAIAVNDSLNVFVTGYSAGLGTGFDYATLKYDQAGTLKWEKRLNGHGNGDDKPVGMALSGNSSLYIAGTVLDTNQDYGVIKYVPTSGDSVWFSEYKGETGGNDVAKAMYLGSSGNIYVTGASPGPDGTLDYGTVKFNSSGVEQWRSRFTGSGNNDDVPVAIAVAGSTKVFVTGRSINTGSYADIVTVCYSASSGNQQWVNNFDGTGNDDDYPVAVSNGTNPYVLGATSVYGAGLDYTLISIKGSNGDTQWSQSYGATGYADDVPSAMLVNGSSVYITGKSFGDKSNYDYLTIHFAPTTHLLYRSFTQADLTGKAAGLKTPLSVPNMANVRDAAFLGAFPKLKKGFAGAPGGMVIGKVRADSASTFGWMRVTKGASLAAMVPATGTPRGFVSTELVGEKKDLKVSKYNNKLVGDLLALKLGIGASDAGITPPTFGDLVYDDGDTSNHYNGMSLRQLASYVDNVLTYSFRYTNVHYDTLDLMIAKVNSAFSGPLTVASSNPVMASGVALIDTITFLTPSASPLANPLQFEKGSLDEVPREFTLFQNYPNPFNPTTNIQFDLPVQSVVTLKVYDILGREVSTLLDRQEMEEGKQEVRFDGGNLASGVYFYRLVANEGRIQIVKKMLLMR